jgi:hypothetical protein
VLRKFRRAVVLLEGTSQLLMAWMAIVLLGFGLPPAAFRGQTSSLRSMRLTTALPAHC